MIKLSRVIILITLPIALIMIFASLLTTKQYLMISENRYESHEDIYFDYEYAADRIMGYLNYRYDDLLFGVDEGDDSVIMSDTELRHMVDVKNLYTGLRVFAATSLIIAVSLLFFLKKKGNEEVYKTLKMLPLGPIFFILFIGSFMIIDFDSTFTKFHELFFSNDDWLLYSDDALILLLPENFWLVSGMIILLLFSISLGLIYFLNEKYYKKTLS